MSSLESTITFVAVLLLFVLFVAQTLAGGIYLTQTVDNEFKSASEWARPSDLFQVYKHNNNTENVATKPEKLIQLLDAATDVVAMLTNSAGEFYEPEK